MGQHDAIAGFRLRDPQLQDIVDVVAQEREQVPVGRGPWTDRHLRPAEHDAVPGLRRRSTRHERAEHERRQHRADEEGHTRNGGDPSLSIRRTMTGPRRRRPTACSRLVDLQSRVRGIDSRRRRSFSRHRRSNRRRAGGVVAGAFQSGSLFSTDAITCDTVSTKCFRQWWLIGET